jgi:uncharacterized 2Fe-2S/4Fe-4S cluster protein (DUF4445 family)
MPQVTFRPSGIQTKAHAGDTLVDIIKKAGINLDLPCGGKGTCGRCIVKIENGNVESDDIGKLSQTEIDEGYVCACRTKILTADIEIEIPDQVTFTDEKKFDTPDDFRFIQKELLPSDSDYKPLASKHFIQIPPPKNQDGLSDIDRLTKQIQFDLGSGEIFYPLSIIRQAADILRKEHGAVTITIVREHGCYHIINLEPGDTTGSHYGIAIDVGTTTVVAQLTNLIQKKVVATVTDYNAQIRCGVDIISRINYAGRPERLDELRQLITGTINKLIDLVSIRTEIEKADITNAVLSGNTTMIHLLLGLKPEYIRLEPYVPTLLHVPYIKAKDADIDIHPEAWLYFSPSVGSYVGGDITAGLLCTPFAANTEKINLYIDIGTNGEIVLGNNEFLIACACSAGPAFEGGGIENGMRAAAGAIDKVEVDRVTGKVHYSTIGNAKPVGICGTGIISLLSNLLMTGWIDRAGKLNRERKCDAIVTEGKKASFLIVPAEQSGTNKTIRISEVEIENVIRAKAAIYSACSLLMKHMEVTFDDISTLYIAGGFGRFLNLDDARNIGLIPDLPSEKFRYIGNASLIGSYMILVSQTYREKQISLTNRMTYIDLSITPGYMDQYTAALFMPHTDQNLFPNVNALLQELNTDNQLK